MNKLYGVRIVDDYNKTTGGFAEYETDFLTEDIDSIKAKLKKEGYIYNEKLDSWTKEDDSKVIYIDIIEKIVVTKIEDFIF